MRKLSDHLMFYLERLSKSSHNFLYGLLSALSFIMLLFYFCYIVYYSTIDYSTGRVITGCMSLWAMIYLNKSLYGR